MILGSYLWSLKINPTKNILILARATGGSIKPRASAQGKIKQSR